MTQEDKELLLQDLCARLPYGTMVKCTTDYCHEFDEELSVTHIINFYQFEIKPYLRPMSSMTEEEKEKVELLCDGLDIDDEGNSFHYLTILKNRNSNQINTTIIDWLNKHHFDYRGLIEKDLALEAPEGMYE